MSVKTSASGDLRHWRMPGAMLILLGLAAGSQSSSILDDELWVPGVFILASGLILLPAIRRALRRGTAEILADHFLVLAASYAAYYVFGALLIPFGPESDVSRLLSFYSLDAPLAMRVTAVNCVGCGLAFIAGSLVRRRWFSGWARKAVGFGSNMPREQVIALFLFIGGASHFYALPYDIGLRSGVVPGILRSCSSLLHVAIMLAAAHRGRNWAILLSWSIVSMLVQSFGGLLMLSKSSVLLPMVAMLAGLTSRFGVRRMIIPGLAALLAVYLLIDAPIAAARIRYGLGTQIDVGERISSMSDGAASSSDAGSHDIFHSWTRFSYIAPQGMAIKLYDAGQGDDDYKRLGWSFVPRFLFPNKPIMTASGVDFYYKLTGRTTSSSGHGVFVNGYYNMGWLGVIAVGIAVGCILACTSIFAAEVYGVGSLIWLPFALFGSLMAFRIDGHFLCDYWGTFAMFCYAVFIGALMQGSHRSHNSFVTLRADLR